MFPVFYIKLYLRFRGLSHVSLKAVFTFQGSFILLFFGAFLASGFLGAGSGNWMQKPLCAHHQ
jgi:hypothetical protein